MVLCSAFLEYWVIFIIGALIVINSAIAYIVNGYQELGDSIFKGIFSLTMPESYG